MKKRLILIAILIAAVFAGWYFLFRKIEQKVEFATYDPEITKNQKYDPKDKSLAMVLVLQPDKKRRPVIIRKGITDGMYTEIKEVVWGKIDEGEEVILGSMQDLETAMRNPSLQQVMGGAMGGPPRR